VLRELRLKNFRSFKDFTITFGDGAYLVGPNNAGKSTILTALRTADILLRYAQRRNPTINGEHNNNHYVAYPVYLREFPALLESVRYDFRGEEASFQLTWKSEARLTVVWPQLAVGGEPEPFFYLEKLPGIQVRTVVGARSAFARLGIIPVIGPIEHSEQLLQDEYVKSNITGRLSSRHFRNQLRLMRQERRYSDFSEFANPWLDELTIESFSQHMSDEGAILDVFYRERDSRIPKELVWAGDGIQVWLQLLYHVYRVRDFETIILDEPEVYLHPDLQRRLVHLLEATSRQVILATHSAEVVAEAEPKLVTMIEKSRSRARRARKESDLQFLSSALGTAFNLRLAKALRSDVVLFVEGEDMTLIVRMARTLGFGSIANDRGVTVIPLKGYSKWGEVTPFAWLTRELLPDVMKIFVILDRDYRPDSVIAEVEHAFEREDVVAHIWRRKELESYLLVEEAIARLAGAPLARIRDMVNGASAELGEYVFGQMLVQRQLAEVTAKRDSTVIFSNFKKEFDELWKDPAYRLRVAPAKQILSRINRRLMEAGKFRTISARGLATALRVEEIGPEMSGTLRRVEDSIAALKEWTK
jgi:energy-coupling factor transporter ATP-binding protein EcfA2